MPEAEDVLTDVARHVTVQVSKLLRARRRASQEPLELSEALPRLELLLVALHGGPWRLGVAQAPASATALTRLFLRGQRPWPVVAVPYAAQRSLWLPRRLEGVAPDVALELYRAMVVQQAARALLRESDLSERLPGALERDLYLVLEAEAADAALSRDLPGLAGALCSLREEAWRRRPKLESFGAKRLPLERWFRERRGNCPAPLAFERERLIQAALKLKSQLASDAGGLLLKDWWLGDWPVHEPFEASGAVVESPDASEAPPTRSARLERRPRVRQAKEGEDDERPGPFMIQTSPPHEDVEDPFGAQRPTDRDAESPAEGHAESVAELPEARLVRTPGKAHEVLLSDDPPVTAANATAASRALAGVGFRYPEWDYRLQSYREPGTTVFESLAAPGPALWVRRTLEAQGPMLQRIRRQFELLRAQRVTLHRQEEGDELDLDACIEARSDLRAGAAMSQRLYRRERVARRDTAVLVLVDVSGSTDSWLSGQRRIIDVEREALLALSLALDGVGEPYAVLGFSGEGPSGVSVRIIKRFDERHGEAVALRIAGLEPESYTRTGAALRHAARLLAEQTAQHRLLLLLSDGKPNDCDDYEGRYGVEDTRQAVYEARDAGLSPFCLTVDRQAAAYLPRVFGPHHYALLQQPERLPTVLLDWMKRLLRQ